MGAAVAVAKKQEGSSPEKKDGVPKDNSGKGTKRRLSMLRIKRAGSDDKNKFMGVTLEFRGADGTGPQAPNGCTMCNCSERFDLGAVEASGNFYITEYIEEETKKMTNYVPNKLRSGPTQRGAKYHGPWFHPESAAEAPKEVRVIVTHYKEGEWVEPWHVTKWIKYQDPYTHVKSRFRIWRRIEKTNQAEDVTSPQVEEGNQSDSAERNGGAP